MKEVKPSKKPLAIYYAIVLLVLLVINLVVMPWLAERQVQEVDYGTFMSMTEQENIGKVDIQSNQIIFTDKDNKQIYKTGLMNDPGLTERLYDAGAQFSSEIVEQGSPVLSFLLWFVLPQLPDQPLAGRVWLVHHGVEGVFNDGRLVLGHHNVLFLACPVVINPHLDMLGIPFQNATRPHGQDVVGVGLLRVQGRVHRDHSHTPLILSCKSTSLHSPVPCRLTS